MDHLDRPSSAPLPDRVPAPPAAADAGLFDPEAPLAGAPEPWAASTMPRRLEGGPSLMSLMIEAEPALAERLLRRLLGPGVGSSRSASGSGAGGAAGTGGAAGAGGAPGAAVRLAEAIREALVGGGSVVATGCGTSEHGALGAVEILRDAAARAGLASGGRVVAAQAFEAAQAPAAYGIAAGSLLLAISHEGGTAATNAALAAGRAAGAQTALVTVSGRSPGAALADIVVETGEQDASWCHTVGYLSPLLVATATGSLLGESALDTGEVRALIAAGVAGAHAAERLAAALADARGLLVIASGADRPAARELVLKVEEAAWLPSAMRDLETFLHGHLPATDAETGLVLVLADSDARPARLARARQALEAAAAIGLRAGAIVARGADADLPAALTPAGRLVVEEAPVLPPPVAALLGTAAPLQLLTERLSRARGTDPDRIRRQDPRYLEAAERAEG